MRHLLIIIILAIGLAAQGQIGNSNFYDQNDQKTTDQHIQESIEMIQEQIDQSYQNLGSQINIYNSNGHLQQTIEPQQWQGYYIYDENYELQGELRQGYMEDEYYYQDMQFDYDKIIEECDQIIEDMDYDMYE